MSKIDYIDNNPALWQKDFNWPTEKSHKYSRGQVLISAGRDMTGAAILAGRAALRAGAGVVSMAVTPETRQIFAISQPEFLLHNVKIITDFETLLKDERRTVILLGSGAGMEKGGKEIRARIKAALKTGRSVVIDADGLSAFANSPEELFALCHEKVVLTPHEGEFARLFPDIKDVDKAKRAVTAAKKTGCIVMLKGAKTIIAAPDGRAIINSNAPPSLATAGSGDVLAGIVAGLLASDMPVFEAAAAGVWLHGAVAAAFGQGLIASDIVDNLPSILTKLHKGDF